MRFATVVATASVAGVAVNAALPNGFTYQGCYTDDYPTLRVLGGAYHVGSDVTTEYCINYCVAAGYKVAGTEYGNECYCGNFVDTDNVSYGIPSTQCTYACAGDQTEICGGNTGISVYTASPLQFSSVTVNTAKPPPAGYSIVGCYSDNYPTGRVLNGASLVQQSQLTTEKCTSYCTGLGYKYSGTEYSRECFCGNTITTDGSTYGVISNQCNTPCTGDAKEICGGSNHLYVYSQIGATPSSTTTTASTTTAATTTTTKASTTTTTSSSSSTSAVAPAGATGLNYAYFTNPTLNTGYGYPQFDVSSFNGKSPIFTGTTDRIGFPSTGPNSPVSLYPGAPSRSVEQLAIVHTGYVYARTSGTYTFTVNALDDVIYAWIGSNAYSSYSASPDIVAAYFGIANTVTSVSKTVTAGSLIPFKILWANGANIALLGFTITGPNGVLLSSTAGSAVDILTTPTGSTQALTFPAVAPISSTCKTGFTYANYQNPFRQTPDGRYTTFDPAFFATQTPVMTGSVGNINYASPSSTVAATVYKGWFAPSVAGWYKFTITSADDIAYLYFGDGAGNRYTSSNSVASASYGGGGSVTFPFYSPAGQLVPVTVVYGNAGGAANLQLNIVDPAGNTQTDTTNYFKGGVC